jgi:4-hydroxybenzoate polyprenyltransferase
MWLGLVRTMRPHQWVKNLFVLAPLVFAQELLHLSKAVRALAGFAVFCLLAGGVYILNDLVDVEADRQHPVKRHRPIASGEVSEREAKVALAVVAIVALAGALALGLPFLATAVGYLILNLAYSFSLKKLAYVDVLCIATGFELRVLAGSFAAQVPPSAYLLIVTFLLATFLGLGKRAHELAVSRQLSTELAEYSAISSEAPPHSPAITRASLRAYDARVLVPLLFVTGGATILTYIVYTFDPQGAGRLGTAWMPWTIPFAVFGTLRFAHLVRRKANSESPTDAMLRDLPFVANLLLWAVVVVAIVYFT